MPTARSLRGQQRLQLCDVWQNGTSCCGLVLWVWPAQGTPEQLSCCVNQHLDSRHARRVYGLSSAHSYGFKNVYEQTLREKKNLCDLYRSFISTHENRSRNRRVAFQFFFKICSNIMCLVSRSRNFVWYACTILNTLCSPHLHEECITAYFISWYEW